MSERGFFAIDRGVWDHPLFAREKFSEREAWFWLISSAAWEPIKVRIGRGWFDLARGQCAFALRFLATKWMWSEPRVRRFLKRLTDDAAVLVSATREATLITICNYNDYQLSRRADVPGIDAALVVKSTNPRRKEEETKQSNNQQIKTDQRKRAARLPADAVPSDRNKADAAEQGLNAREVDDQWTRMRNWSASAKNGACLDWDARWRNWCSTFMDGRKPGTGPPSRPLTEFQRGRNETKDILNDLDVYATGGTGSQENPRLLSGDTGERPKGIRGGSGGDVINLPTIGSRSSG